MIMMIIIMEEEELMTMILTMKNLFNVNIKQSNSLKSIFSR